MQDEHIVSGDYVMVEKTKTARDGEIVVALVDGSETTLKRFYKEGDKIRLQPANTAMQPIMVPAALVQIQGRVIGVLRKYSGIEQPRAEDVRAYSQKLKPSRRQACFSKLDTNTLPK